MRICIYTHIHVYVKLFSEVHSAQRGNSQNPQEGKFQLDIRKNSAQWGEAASKQVPREAVGSPHLEGLNTQLDKGPSNLT